ncbi:hypothetical protein T4D_7373 [Trichinella pseudospiralis]|uniref:Uncharacterized protein n=1 Tax=Trichinella pseudospiralis TaxID=6337 RepID=A0A0V1F6Z1_TRIPS|nr:hypothetical protein T4D_7373 [Trichinella pseudospiralis]
MRDRDGNDLKTFGFSQKSTEIRLFKLTGSSNEEKNSTSGSNASGACMHCTFSICNKAESSFAIVRCIKYHNLVHLQCETNANKDNCSRNESAPKIMAAKLCQLMLKHRMKVVHMLTA